MLITEAPIISESGAHVTVVHDLGINFSGYLANVVNDSFANVNGIVTFTANEIRVRLAEYTIDDAMNIAHTLNDREESTHMLVTYLDQLV